MLNLKDITKYAVLVSVLSTFSTIISMISATEDMSEDIYSRILFESFNSAMIILIIEDIFVSDIEKNEDKSFNEIFNLCFFAVLKSLRLTLNKLFKEKISRSYLKELLSTNGISNIIQNKINQMDNEEKINDLAMSFSSSDYYKIIKELVSRYFLVLIFFKNLEKFSDNMAYDFKIQVGNLLEQLDIFLNEKNSIDFENRSDFIKNSLEILKKYQNLIDNMLNQIKDKKSASLFLYLI